MGILGFHVTQILHESHLLGVIFYVVRWLVTILLKEDQVTAHLGTRFIHEQVVGQTHSSHQIRLIQHGASDVLVSCGIHHTLTGDEGHQTAVPNFVQGLHEEIIVQGLCCLDLGCIAAVGINRVKDVHITERDVGRCHVKLVLIIFMDGLIPCDMNIAVTMKGFQDQTCQQILLKGGHFQIGMILTERINESALA